MFLDRHLKFSIDRAEQSESKLHGQALHIDGMSGYKGRHFLNNIGNAPNIRYLEIGSWKGSTLVAAAFDNEGRYVGVDNFSQFGGPKQELHDNLDRFLSKDRVSFHDLDMYSEELQKALLSYDRFNVYFFDGPHGEDDHCAALSIVLHHLEDEFIFIVDDWLGPEVQNGTKKSIKNLGLDIIFETVLGSGKDSDKEGYWNDLGVYLLRKSSNASR